MFSLFMTKSHLPSHNTLVDFFERKYILELLCAILEISKIEIIEKWIFIEMNLENFISKSILVCQWAIIARRLNYECFSCNRIIRKRIILACQKYFLRLVNIWKNNNVAQECYSIFQQMYILQQGVVEWNAAVGNHIISLSCPIQVYNKMMLTISL